MVTALLGLALAADVSLTTRYASAFGPDAWGTVHLRAEAAPDLDVGALAVGGTRAALLATVGRRFHLGERLIWRGELQAGARRTAADEPGGPLVGFETGAVAQVTDPVAAVLDGGWLPGLGAWAEAGADAVAAGRFGVFPRLMASTWAGDRDLALRVELGGGYRAPTGWFVRASVGAGGRDTVHLGPSAGLVLGRQS